jgi:glycosyltransferase involved in cell wall biosynthesis
MKPTVSIILPVYNGERYLGKAIQSVLDQTLTQLELIIVDDCSTDKTSDIIKAFDDNRIVYHRHSRNTGVVGAMNTGLGLVTAEYVAVMHADDICLPERLQLQKQWLDEHTDAAVIAGKIIFIDTEDQPIGLWDLDQQKINRLAIKRTMIIENCIAHSSIMMRTALARRYGYELAYQKNGYAVEDYPLWLNFLSDGYWIDKLSVPVTLYRTHPKSATSSYLRKSNPFLINYHTKKTFLQLRKEKEQMTAYDRWIWLSMQADLIKANLKELKAKIIKKHV